MPTRKPRMVAAIHPQKDTKRVFNKPTKYTFKCVSVDLKSKKGEKLISKPAGILKNLQPVAIFLFSRLYAVVLTRKYIPKANKPTTNTW